ncbi:MAG: hypothetical protein FWE04_01125 [Oscillospiraceae bacterium]|nr:hypothetical protein [Oscillospiraceae bacterium]
MNYKKYITDFVCYGISLIIYLLIFLYGISITDSANYFGFVLLIFYPVTTITSFVCSLILQLFNARLKWIYPFLFAIFGFVIAISILPVRHSEVWLPAVVAPFLGTVIGFLIRKIKEKIKKD